MYAKRWAEAHDLANYLHESVYDLAAKHVEGARVTDRALRVLALTFRAEKRARRRFKVAIMRSSDQDWKDTFRSTTRWSKALNDKEK